ncbi:hypothetical protein Tco_1417683 [Tanacetum coccineum]
MHKTAIVSEAQENVAKVQEKILKEDIEKMVKEPESQKKTLEVVDDDDIDNNVEKEKKNDDVEEKKDDKNDDNDDHDDHMLVIGEVSSNKTLFEELTANVSPTPDTTSKDPNMSQPPSSISKILPGSDTELSRRHEKTNELIKEEIPRMGNDAVKKDREIFADVVPELVSKEFATHAPKIIKELFKCHMKNKVLNVHLTKCGMFLRRNSKSLLHQPVQAKFMMHIKANDGSPEGEEEWAKSQKTLKGREVGFGERGVMRAGGDCWGCSGEAFGVMPALIRMGEGLEAYRTRGRWLAFSDLLCRTR